jgi:AcrR family transcriptional regulator
MGRAKQVSDQAVLEAAKAAFVEDGYGASTREIARRAGISEAVLFQRYRTKLELFYAAMIPPPLELPGEASGQGLSEDLGILAASIMAYFRDAMPVLLQLVLHPSFNLTELADGETRIPLHRLGDAIATCLERHRREGVITAGPERVQAATLTLIASIHSLALFERMGIHGGKVPDAAVRNIVGLVVAGLTAEKGGRP